MSALGLILAPMTTFSFDVLFDLNKPFAPSIATQRLTSQALIVLLKCKFFYLCPTTNWYGLQTFHMLSARSHPICLFKRKDEHKCSLLIKHGNSSTSVVQADTDVLYYFPELGAERFEITNQVEAHFTCILCDLTTIVEIGVLKKPSSRSMNFQVLMKVLLRFLPHSKMYLISNYYNEFWINQKKLFIYTRLSLS